MKRFPRTPFALLGAIALLLQLSPAAEDLAGLKSAHQKAVAALDKEVAKHISVLNRGYRQNLEKLEAKYRKRGALDEVVTLRAEIKRFGATPDDPLGDGSSIPELPELQRVFSNERKKYRGDQRAKRSEMTKSQIAALTTLLADLREADKLDEALAARSEIVALRATLPSLGGAARSEPVPPPAPAGKTDPNLPKGYTIYYPFDEPEPDGRVLDHSPNNLHGVTKTNMWTNAGKRGGAFEFTTRERIKLEHQALLQPESFTIAAWVNLKEPSSYGRLCDKYEHSAQTGFGLQVNELKPTLELWDTTPRQRRVTAPEPLVIGKWYHVAATFTPGLGLMYIDGDLVDENRIDGPFVPNESAIRIGYDEGRPLNGHLDEFVFYPRALDIAEIQRLMKETSK